MDSLLIYQEHALDTLYRWTLRQCRSMHLDVSTSLRTSMTFLLQRPSLYQTCLDEVSKVREAHLSSSFQKWIASNASTDSFRLGVDALAWVHLALASEKEYLRGLVVEDSFDRLSSLLMHVFQGIGCLLEVFCKLI